MSALMGGHTPGEWRIDGPPVEGRNPNMGLWEVEADHGHIASNLTWADAHLVSAAPDLLESLDPDTLEAIADEITEGDGWFKHSARAASLRGIAKRQRAAIARATLQDGSEK